MNERCGHEQKQEEKQYSEKMIGILIGLGIITGPMCFLNLMAYGVLEDYSLSLQETVDALQNASGTEAASLSENADFLLERIEIKITGTYIFDIILMVISALVTVGAIFMSLKMIVGPTKKVSKTLDEIMTSIQNNEGDLTARVDITGNDESGQMASGTNEFVALLQENMVTMSRSAGKMQESMDVVTTKVESSNASVTIVSSSSQELAASVEEVAATIQEIATNSTNLLN